MLLLSVFSLLIGPATLALSRYHEHEADRFGAGADPRQSRRPPRAFVALQRAEPGGARGPGGCYKLFRASHPPIGERVDFINTYRPWEHGEPERYMDHFHR